MTIIVLYNFRYKKLSKSCTQLLRYKQPVPYLPPTKHDVKDIIKTFEDYLQVLQTKTSRHQNVNDLEIIYYLRFA